MILANHQSPYRLASMGAKARRFGNRKRWWLTDASLLSQKASDTGRTVAF